MSNQYLEHGAVLGERFVIAEELGRGGISVVYAAFDRKLQLNVAIKLLVPPPANAEQIKERSRREVAYIRELDHPHIARVYDFIESGSHSFIVMKKIDGLDLKKYIEKHGAIAEEFLVQIGHQISSALQFAHSHGILHRDVKPSNILISSNRQAYLTDFGSARMEGQQTITSTGSFVGTLNYLPPEVFEGARPDARGDIYSLALSLYFASLGCLPKINPATMLVEPQIDGHSPAESGAPLSASISQLIAMCTSETPGNRLQTAQAFYDALAGNNPLINTQHKKLPELRMKCLICEIPDPLGQAICSRCSLSDGEGSSTQSIVLKKPKGKNAIQELSNKLSAYIGRTHKKEDLDLVASGVKPLAQVPLAYAPKAIARLEKLGLKANLLPSSKLWSTLPLSFTILMLEILLLNFYNAIYVNPVFAILGPVVVTLLTLAALKYTSKPLLNWLPSISNLPEGTEQRVLQTVVHIKPGATRNLLTDVIRTAQEMSQKFTAEAEISALIERSCEVADQLSNYEKLILRLESKAKDNSSVVAALGEAERARNLLSQRLLETLGTLAILGGSNVDHVGSELAEITEELKEEVEHKEHAQRELEQLLLGTT
jgi:serine/threonine protein kinase